MNPQDTIIKKEKELVEKLKKEFPEQFQEKTILEDNTLLKKFGILIENKESLPPAYIKTFCSDFIVEEITEYIPENLGGKHITFELIKCGISTIDFANNLAKDLNINTKDITYAGIKDKKAITFQTISIKNNPQLIEQIKTIKSDNFIIKNVRKTKDPIQMSGLKGNKFTILARNKELSQNEKNSIEENINNILNKGFLNYYYLQRFGTPRLISANLGYLILKGEFEKVIKTLLFKPAEFEIEYFTKLRIESEKKYSDWLEIKKYFGQFSTILTTENTLLDFLINNPNDFEGALKEIPEQTQIWVYAFISLLFNHKINQENNTEKTPLCLTNNQKNIAQYENLLKAVDFYPVNFDYAKKLMQINLADRFINTKIKPKNLNHKYLEGAGIVFEFELEKGAYATTLLSHFINIVSSNKKNDDSIINIKDQEFEKFLEYFKNIINN